MTKEDLAAYRDRLIVLRQEHLKERDELSHHIHNSQRDAAGDLSAYSLHLADIAADSYEREKDMKLVSDVSNMLYEIDEALYRIEKGAFGLCEGCQQEINSNRLSAIPYARLCKECKENKEQER